MCPSRALMTTATVALLGGLVAAGPAAAAAVQPAAAPAVDLVVEDRPTVDRQGRVTVRGTVTCDAPASVSMWVGAQQTRGEGTTYSLADEPFGSVSVRCSGSPVAWTHTFGTYVGPLFAPGTATIRTPMIVWEGEMRASAGWERHVETAVQLVPLRRPCAPARSAAELRKRVRPWVRHCQVHAAPRQPVP